MNDDDKRPIQIIINIPDLSSLTKPWKALVRSLMTFRQKVVAFASSPPRWFLWLPGIILVVAISLVRTSVTLDEARQINRSRASFEYWKSAVNVSPTPQQLLAMRYDLRFPIGENEKRPKRIELAEQQNLVGPAFRINSMTYNIWLALNGPDVGPRDATYNPFVDPQVKGTRFEEYLGRFTYSRNTKHTAQIIAGIDRQERDRLALLGAGSEGVLVGTILGVFDPLMLLLVLLSYQGIRSLYRDS